MASDLLEQIKVSNKKCITYIIIIINVSLIYKLHSSRYGLSLYSIPINYKMFYSIYNL